MADNRTWDGVAFRVHPFKLRCRPSIFTRSCSGSRVALAADGPLSGHESPVPGSWVAAAEPGSAGPSAPANLRPGQSQFSPVSDAGTVNGKVRSHGEGFSGSNLF